MTFTMGIDQYGQHYDDLGIYPRKELLKRLGYKSAFKMYVDKDDGSTAFVGYTIGSCWITLYQVKPFEVKTK